jgi:hypothetical protein
VRGSATTAISAVAVRVGKIQQFVRAGWDLGGRKVDGPRGEGLVNVRDVGLEGEPGGKEIGCFHAFTQGFVRFAVEP